MKVLHVVGSYYPAVSHGGPVAANRALCRSLVSLGVEVRVLTTNANGRGKLSPEFLGWRTLDGYEVFYGNRWLWRDLSPALMGTLGQQVGRSDVVHVTGTYNWFLPLVVGKSRRLRKPVVVSAHGSLLPEARENRALRKRVFDTMVQGRALRGVSAFHATSEVEALALRVLLPGARVAVVPNGVDVPIAPPKREDNRPPYLLYLGRLHPYKKVAGLVRAFEAAVKAEPRGTGGDWALVIAGEGEPSYRRELERVARECGVSDRVRFQGYVVGDEKSGLLANAGVLVLASKSENFGMSVAEALAHGTPCVVTRTAPWEGLEREGCGCWVDDSGEALAEGMRRLMALSSDERRAMGARGRAWMERDFSWDSVARRLVTLYKEVAR